MKLAEMAMEKGINVPESYRPIDKQSDEYLVKRGLRNAFRVVFVCAMWLTGFDVKSLSCLYLDKPLKAHTLMQTIARTFPMSC